jgi:hypothetical protein
MFDYSDPYDYLTDDDEEETDEDEASQSEGCQEGVLP